MRTIDMKKFEKDMAVFSFNQHQTVMAYLKHLKVTGWTIEEAEKWVEVQKSKISQNTKKQSKILIKQCPVCPALMYLYPVNISPDTQTGDNSKSVWLCQSKNCMHTIYNLQTVEEILSKKR